MSSSRRTRAEVAAWRRMRGVVTVASDALRRRAIDAGLVWDMAASRSSRDHLSLRQSKIKPLCDGTHRGIGFREDGTAADVRS